MHLVFFTLAMLMPWILGFAIMKPFLRQRNGYLLFAIGAGYVLGWFVVTLILRMYDYFERPFNIYEVVVIECAMAIPLLFFPAKALRYHEVQTKERSPSKLVWLLSGLIVCLLLYRWGLTSIDLVSKPVFPWDGWLSWSAKAKIFYYYDSIPSLYGGFAPFWSFDSMSFVPVGGARHTYFISLVQAYNAMAWGEWRDNMVNLPWLSCNIAMASIVFGGLRYLGSGVLVSVLSCYATVSLPILDTHTSLGSYAELWVGLTCLVIVFLLTMSLVLNERVLFIQLLLFVIVIYLTKHTALIFMLALGVGICWRLGGRFFSLSFFILGGLALFFLHDWINKELARFFSSLLASGVTRISYNPVLEETWMEWGVLDNWHYMILASLVGIVLLLFQGRRNMLSAFELFSVISFSLLFMMVVIVFFTEKLSENNFVGYFNRVTLYFAPTLTVALACIYNIWICKRSALYDAS